MIWRALGLERDPCGPVTDPLLLWDAPGWAGALRRAAAALEACRGVWVRGPAGAGRQTFVEVAAADAAARGMPVLWVAREPRDAGDFLDTLLELAGVSPGEGDAAARAVRLYGELLEAFCERGPSVLGVSARADRDDVRDEWAALASLRVAGCPIVLPLLWGEGPPPMEPLEEIGLPAWEARALRALLEHRLEAAGASGLVSAEALSGIAESARGPGEAIGLLRVELARVLFRGTGSPGGKREPVLDPGELSEVEALLSSLDGEPAADEN